GALFFIFFSPWRFWAVPFVFEGQSTIPIDSISSTNSTTPVDSIIVDSITKFVDTTLFLPRFSSS
ncbi:hypothetical protein ISN45_Aa07g002800, partial [Arabidopsis thaliana x Arabidopsis arenosa]